MRSIGIAACAALGVVLALIWSGTAQACSSERPDWDYVYGESDAAVIARLIDVEYVKPGSAATRLTYRIRRSFHSSPRLRRGDRVVVRQGGTSCDAPTAEGRYGIFLNFRRARWRTSGPYVISPRKMRRIARRAD